MKEKDVTVNGKKCKVIVGLPKDYIEKNDKEILLDDTIDLSKLLEEISSNGNNG